ncbi:hypothetical protein RRG08_007684 [Elysia crispata]|uniref:Uncharacterized protein n=1 Tax=Elysia crispata TaxID=231223 RepID=A0AAE0ZZC3_9GAST|nr:hypothetical protein RRG08_007684 [Elysia crispata]
MSIIHLRHIKLEAELARDELAMRWDDICSVNPRKTESWKDRESLSLGTGSLPSDISGGHHIAGPPE